MTQEYRDHLVAKIRELNARYARAMEDLNWDVMSECSTLRAIHLDGLTSEERCEVEQAERAERASRRRKEA